MTTSYSVREKITNAIPNGILAGAESLLSSIMAEISALSEDTDDEEVIAQEPTPTSKEATPERTRRFREQKALLAQLKEENARAQQTLMGCCATSCEEVAQPSSLGGRVWENWKEETANEEAMVVPEGPDVFGDDFLEDWGHVEEADEISSPVTPLYLKFSVERKERAALHRRSLSM